KRCARHGSPRSTPPVPPAPSAKPPSRCTAESATPGNAWPTCICGGPWCPPNCFPYAWSRPVVDYRDSPEEAAFRQRLCDWLAGVAGKYPTSGDEYWARQGEWHAELYRAGF